MVASKEALETIFRNYPGFIYASDHYYDAPNTQVLLYIEMYNFFDYLWKTFDQSESFDFDKLENLFKQLVLIGDDTVRYAIQVCFAEQVHKIDTKISGTEPLVKVMSKL